MYEAWFCCSMRFAEGLKYLSLSRFIELENNKYLMLYPEKYSDNEIDIDIDYYFNNKISIKSRKNILLSIYIPDELIVKKSNIEYKIDGNLITLDVLKDKDIDIEIELSINKERNVYYLGDMLLTRKEKHSGKMLMIDGMPYSYVLSSSDYSREELEKLEQFL